MSPDAVSEAPKCSQMLLAGALPRTPLRELTALPRPHALSGPTCKERERRGNEKTKDKVKDRRRGQEEKQCEGRGKGEGALNCLLYTSDAADE